MRRWVLLLVLFLPLAGLGQSILHIPMQQCVWRSGDNAAWAAPRLNDAGWKPWDQIANRMARGSFPPPRLWMRCPADLSSLRAVANPALQVSDDQGAYRIFLNGKEIGGAGNLRTAAHGMDTIRQYPVPVSLIGKAPDTVALRITLSYPFKGWDFGLFAGELDALRVRRDRQIVAQGKEMLLPALSFFVVGIAGLMLLGLFYYDRSRRELLYLSIVGVSLAAFSANLFFGATQVNYSSQLAVAVSSPANMVLVVANVLFYFTLARRRVPWYFWVGVSFVLLLQASLLLSRILPPDDAYWFAQFVFAPWIRYLGEMGWIFSSAAPFFAFWPWRRITGRMRPLAALSMVLGAWYLLWFTLQYLPHWRLGLPNYFALWQFRLLEVQAIVVGSVLLALLALLFRDQRLVTEERAALAGEMQAAQEIQRMLVPAKVETIPGIKLEVAFEPMRDVGGDFYQCRILPDGTQRILLGDVSGKGAAAAMTGAVLIGASDLCDAQSPRVLLGNLNQVLHAKRLGGFATCLCADISKNGTLTVANAGHLSPYRNGDEVEVDSGLPLGVTEAAEYTEKTVQLAPGDTLTFLSDGVIEARNADGELFGFERTREISGQAAEQIAQTAQEFGQEDDITVLTMRLAGA